MSLVFASTPGYSCDCFRLPVFNEDETAASQLIAAVRHKITTGHFDRSMGVSEVEQRSHSQLCWQADHHRAIPPELGHDVVALGKLGRIGPRQPPLHVGGVEPPGRRHDPAKS